MFVVQNDFGCPSFANFLQSNWIGLSRSQLEQIGIRCRSVINCWNDHLIVSTSGLSLEDSYCTSSDSAVIEGRCKDFTALRKRNSALKNDCADGGSKLNGLKFIILKYLVSPIASSSVTHTVTVQLSQLADLNKMTDSIFLANIDSYNVNRLMKWMLQNDVAAVFCSDSVSDDIAHIAAAAGVTLVSQYNDSLHNYTGTE